MKAFLRPIRSPTLLPIRMNAADTSASSAMADCTPLTVVSRSLTTAAIDTFITDVSTTRTNMAAASRNDSRCALFDAFGSLPVVASLIAADLSERSCGEDVHDPSARDHFAEWAQTSGRGASAAFCVEHATASLRASSRARLPVRALAVRIRHLRRRLIAPQTPWTASIRPSLAAWTKAS